MVIDKIKYDDVFELWKECYPDENICCLICKNKIKVNDQYYRTFNIHCLENRSDPFCGTQMTKICTTCVKSSQHAEEVSIPLLKILYGGVIKVLRFASSDSYYKLHRSDRIKDFYY